MTEPTSLQRACRIALVINGNIQIAKKAYHWSIQLLDTSNGTCVCKYHVVGSPRNFRYEATMNYDLQASRSVLTNKELAVLQPAQLTSFHEAVHAVDVDNSDDQWNCQTYIMEVIHQLEQRGLVPANTYADCAALM